VAGGRLPAYARSVRVRLLVLLLVSAPLAAAAQEEEEVVYREPPSQDHVRVIAWGGTLIDVGGGQGPSVGHLGGEASWAFESLEVGVLAEGYRLGSRGKQPWSPVVLARFVQRFETRRGLDATLGFGLGAGQTDRWVGWYQIALGLRLVEGPIFIAGEVGFEQLNLFRLAAGIGVKF
jgi:hypothetical protein